MSTSYQTEFELLSCKTIFRLEDITPKEADLWMKHLVKEEFTDVNVRTLFEPLEGEEYFENEYNLDELVIRRWKWTHDGCDHILLDINGYPGDNESGCIAFDGEPLLSNSDQSLTKLEFNDATPAHAILFKDRISFFETLRCYCAGNIEDIEDDDIKAFYASPKGIHACILFEDAYEAYRQKFKAIHNKHVELANQYMIDFCFVDKTIVDKIHFSGVRPTNIKCAEWNYKGENYLLAKIRDHYTLCTYLVDTTQPVYTLGPKVFIDDQLVPKSEGVEQTELIQALNLRIHAFTKFLK